MADINEIIRVSILQYQTVTPFFLKTQILTANFQENNLKYYLETLF